MSNKDIDDNMIEQLYKQRKADVSVDKELNEKIVQSLSAASQYEQRLSQKYSHLGFFKVTGIALGLLVLVIPLFTILKNEVTSINSVSNKVAQQSVEYIQLPEPVVTAHPDLLSNDRLLKQYQQVKVPNSSTILTADVKISAFNQHIELILTDQVYDVSIDPEQYFANHVQQGRLFRENDKWFVEYCSKQRYALSESIIKQSLASSPLLDKVIDGMSYDFYSNDSGLIAMLKQTNEQCN